MSAFMHTNKHISACAKGAAPLVGRSPEYLFRLWRDANARSIKVRYGEKGLAKRCGKYDAGSPAATPNQLSLALQSLEYQSNEYKGWRKSWACTLLRMAKEAAFQQGGNANADDAAGWWAL